MEFSGQEYLSGLPFPSPGDLPYPGIEPTSLASLVSAGGFFATEPPGKPNQQEEFGKGLEETPRAHPLPRIPLASIHLG